MLDMIVMAANSVFGVATSERLSAGLVYLVGATVGAFAAHGFSLVQWGAAAVAVLGSILVAVMVRTWPAKADTVTS